MNCRLIVGRKDSESSNRRFQSKRKELVNLVLKKINASKNYMTLNIKYLKNLKILRLLRIVLN
jgi:hypothetical protein